MTLDEFKADFASSGNVDRQKLNFFTNLRDDEEEKILVYYAEEKNVGIKGMRSFINILEEKNIQRGILIWSEKMTAAARKVSNREMRTTWPRKTRSSIVPAFRSPPPGH